VLAIMWIKALRNVKEISTRVNILIYTIMYFDSDVSGFVDIDDIFCDDQILTRYLLHEMEDRFYVRGAHKVTCGHRKVVLAW